MFNNKVIQASMGSVFRVNVMYKKLSTYLSKVNTKVYGTFKNGNNVKDYNFDRNCHLLLGNESIGISDELKTNIDQNISIKKFGNEIDSLNVAVSAAIMLHEFTS
jgi:TrmH family RNA methyltransferase